VSTGTRRLDDLRRDAAAAARGVQGGERALTAALAAYEAAGDAEGMARLRRELGALMSASSSLAGSYSVTELADAAAAHALEALGASSVSVSRWEVGAEILRTLVNAGRLAPGETTHPTDEIYRLSSDDPLKQLLLGGKAYAGRVEDPELHPLERALLERLGTRSCAAVPIMLGDRPWGELWATRDGEAPFDEHDLRLLGAIAGQLATGVARAELFERLAELALQDELTGLANREALEERLEVSFDRLADGVETEVTLLLCDVDNLKRLNDMRGHHGGDWALKAVATALRREVEGLPDALVCRLSGDEFGIVAEGVGVEALERVGRAAIDRLAGHRPPVGLSCGVASSKLGVRRASQLLRAADTALYTAKRSGRARVCVADADPRQSGRSTGRPGARRSLRDGFEIDAGTLISHGLALLDGALSNAAPLERLEGLATSLGSTLRASSAAVSLCAHSGTYVETLFKLDLRSGHSSSVRYGVDGERYPLSEYPQTEELLVSGGSLHLYASDPEADAAERAYLDSRGLTDLLMGAASDGRGAWLVEVFGDTESADLALADGVLRLLCAHAVHPAAGLRSDRRATGSLRAVQ